MTPITNFKNQLIGYTDKTNDKIWVYSKNMSPLGYYSESFDKTFTNNGRPLTNGNTIMMLLQG